MLTVHHLNNSRSQRVLWLLEELGLPYEIVHYQRDPNTMLAPASLRAVHPLGKSPVVTTCLLYTSPSPRDLSTSRMPSSGWPRCAGPVSYTHLTLPTSDLV